MKKHIGFGVVMLLGSVSAFAQGSNGFGECFAALTKYYNADSSAQSCRSERPSFGSCFAAMAKTYSADSSFRSCL